MESRPDRLVTATNDTAYVLGEPNAGRTEWIPCAAFTGRDGGLLGDESPYTIAPESVRAASDEHTALRAGHGDTEVATARPIEREAGAL